ncbi:uncharacterized protein JCM15063_003910 [Sporobolomyces koalae]|uniref:uncharacterized protein n=1 Tax=Sporobolomyces koalae TaxID=500713 RepID=UPI00316D0158
MPFRMPPATQALRSTVNGPASPISSHDPVELPAVVSCTDPDVDIPSSSIRLSAPPPLPPKPLHLTVSKKSASASRPDRLQTYGTRSGERRATAAKRGELPRWSRIISVEAEQDEVDESLPATIKAGKFLGEQARVSDDEADEANERVSRREIDVAFARASEEPTMHDLLADTGNSSYRRGQGQESSTDASGTYRSAAGTLTGRGGSTIKRKTIYFDPTLENPLLPDPKTTEVLRTGDYSARTVGDQFARIDNAGNHDGDDRHAAGVSGVIDSGAAPMHQPTLPSPQTDGGGFQTPSLDLPELPMHAVALHPFSGEPTFGELSFAAGTHLCIEIEDLGGGWSLGYERDVGEKGRGLVPRGWYAYPAEISVHSSDIVRQDTDHSSSNTPILEARASAANSEPVVSLSSPLIPHVALDSQSDHQVCDILDQEQESVGPASEQAQVDSELSPSDGRASTYAIASIRRQLIVSGTEFEPVRGDSTQEQIPPLREADQSETKRNDKLGQLEQAASTVLLAEAAPDDQTNESQPVSRNSSAMSNLRALTGRTESPSVSTGSSLRPQSVSHGSIFYRLGLSMIPSSSSLPSSRILLGSLSIPGASILAHSHRPRPVTPTERPELLSRNPVTMTSDAFVLDWIQKGDKLDESIQDETIWHIDSGPTWRDLGEPFWVRIHSPRKVSPFGEQSYTTFQLTTYFPRTFLDPGESGSTSSSSASTVESITVARRYSDFVSFHESLAAHFQILSLPQLPPKVFGSTRFSQDFIEERRRNLERWVEKIGKHPVLRDSELVRGFLSMTEIRDLRALLAHTDAASAEPLFFARVFHPEFNIDVNEAEDIGVSFETEAKAIEISGGWTEASASLNNYRQMLNGKSGAGQANSLQTCATTLAQVVSASALFPASYDASLAFNPEELDQAGEERGRRRIQRNREGALSWTEPDPDAFATTKAVQATAEHLDEISEAIDFTARVDLEHVELVLQELARPAAQHTRLISLHREVVGEYRRLSRLSLPDPRLARCETILNITSAELDYIRRERMAQLRKGMQAWLDAEIKSREESLERLLSARSYFEKDSLAMVTFTGAGLYSRLEKPQSSPVYPPLPAVKSLLFPQSTTAAVRNAIGSSFLRRSTLPMRSSRGVLQYDDIED